MTVDLDRFLYLVVNVGVSFNPTDDDSGSAGFVSQSFPDGDVLLEDRYLYQLDNVGVSFDPTDDDSDSEGFVSQEFPDGWVSEFDDFLYLLANVIIDLRRPGFRFFHMTVSGRPRPFRPSSPRTWT